jgi:hypothetical protein
MGIALIPAAVRETYMERARLSEHYLSGDLHSVNTQGALIISFLYLFRSTHACLSLLLDRDGGNTISACRRPDQTPVKRVLSGPALLS